MSVLDEDHPALAKARVMAEYQEAEYQRVKVLRAFSELAERQRPAGGPINNRATRRARAAQDRKSKVQP